MSSASLASQSALAAGSQTERDFSPLSSACVRALNDKIYDKRKAAALEIEKSDFALSQNPNMRKGGLIGLAAMAIALGKETQTYTEDLVRPVLTCLSDTDSRVRYYACESLYNVIKVSRENTVPIFNDIFNAMGAVITDRDQSVRTGAELLDRLLKDIVTESTQFNLASFVRVLKERMYSKDPFARQFHLGWITTMEKVPNSNLSAFLPELIDGLFLILGDPNADIFTSCENILGDFLTAIRRQPQNVSFTKMINILITHSQSHIARIQMMAVTWIGAFVKLSGSEMLPFTSGILMATLPNLTFDDEQSKHMSEDEHKHIRNLLNAVNVDLMHLAKSCESGDSESSQLELSAILTVLQKQLQKGKVETKLAVLRWMYHLFNICPKKMNEHVDEVFPMLLTSLSDPCDEVVILDLQVLAKICVPAADNKLFDICMKNLLKLFSADKNLLDSKGSFIVRQLCIHMRAEDIYRRLSDLLLEESSVVFARRMVETLSTILLTSSELFELRNTLKDLDSKSSEVFVCLYKTWCHSPVSTVALCLLCGCYEHTSDLVKIISESEVSIDTLLELDRLIQLLESPIFTYLRMRLLDVGGNEHLLRALYGILMLLPQSNAFQLLKNRLECVPKSSRTSTALTMCERRDLSAIDFASLLGHFRRMLDMHRSAAAAHRTDDMLQKGVKNLQLDF